MRTQGIIIYTCQGIIIYIIIFPQETTALQLNIFNKRKRHISENDVAKEGLKRRRQETKSTYLANNQLL